MERYIMIMDWKNQYLQNDYTTQGNLQIQSNPYQITNGSFHRTRTKNFTIHMGILNHEHSLVDLLPTVVNEHFLICKI